MSIRHSRTALAVALSMVVPHVSAAPVEDEAAIVVTATRIPTRINEQLADVTLIERAEIEAAGAVNLPQLLAQQPGLQITSQGGTGKVTGLFTRGSNTGHTLLLVDGVPLGSITLGLPALQNLPLSQIERIEILRGPASSLYGSDAIGGVIQVFTRQGEGPAKPEAFAGFGSRGTRQLAAGISGGSDAISYSLRASRLQTEGFDVASDVTRFQQANFGTSPDNDADGYLNTSLSGQIAFRPARGHEFGLTYIAADSRNEFDGSNPAVDARNDDRTHAWTLYARNRLLPFWNSTLRYGESRDRMRTWDFDLGVGGPAWSLHQTTQKQWTWQNDVRLPLGTLLLAAEHLDQSVESTTSYSVNSRSVRSLIAGWQARMGNHSWQLSQRIDDNSQFGQKTTGNLAYGYQLTQELRARAAVGTAFKAPSFNQLYWPGMGNPDLLPETAKNREVGLEWQGATGARLAWTHFDNRIRNLIAPWPIVNIGRAHITGDSFTGSHTWGPWSAQFSIDLMKPINEDTDDRLPRRAARLGKARIAYAPGPWSIGAELSTVGVRYDSTTQTRPLSRYEIVNLFGHYRLAPDVTLEGRIDNLFDKHYETAWGYANPGVSVFAGLRYVPK